MSEGDMTRRLKDGRIQSRCIYPHSRQDRDTRPRLPIPNPDGLIIRSRQNPRILSMKETCSNVIKICINHDAAQSVTQANAEYKLDIRSGIISVPGTIPFMSLTSGQSEQAFSLFIVPNLDLVVITTRDEDRLRGMEIDGSNGTCGRREGRRVSMTSSGWGRLVRKIARSLI